MFCISTVNGNTTYISPFISRADKTVRQLLHIAQYVVPGNRLSCLLYSALEISMYGCERYYFNQSKDGKHTASGMFSVLQGYLLIDLCLYHNLIMLGFCVRRQYFLGVTAVDHWPV